MDCAHRHSDCHLLTDSVHGIHAAVHSETQLKHSTVSTQWIHRGECNLLHHHLPTDCGHRPGLYLELGRECAIEFVAALFHCHWHRDHVYDSVRVLAV